MSFIICIYVIMHMFTNVLTYVPLDCHIQFHTITWKNKMTKSPCSFDFGPSFYHNNNKNSPFCNSKPIVFWGVGCLYIQENPNIPLEYTPGIGQTSKWKEFLHKVLVQGFQGMFQGYVGKVLEYINLCQQIPPKPTGTTHHLCSRHGHQAGSRWSGQHTRGQRRGSHRFGRSQGAVEGFSIPSP